VASGKKMCFDVRKIGVCHCAAVLQTQIPKMGTNLDLSLLYILTLTYSKFSRKKKFLALGVCFPQPCSSAGRRFAASRSRVQNYRQIVSLPQQQNSMKCVVNWIPLRIRVRSRNTQTHLNRGDGHKSKRGTNSIEFVYL